MQTSFYTPEELSEIGLKSFGNNVLISRKSSIYNPEMITIGNSVRIDDFTILSGGSGIELGNFIHISCFGALFGGAGIRIKDFSTISSRVTIFSESDDYSGMSLTNPMIPKEFKPLFKSKPVDIGQHVIVGTNSSILPGVKIEEGVAIGAHSLVIENCDPWSIYVGTPAIRIKTRSQNILKLEKEFLNKLTSGN